MGVITQGILGGFSGKVGNVIGGNWKGIDYMRVKPASVSNPQTASQMEQRTKFSTVLNFLQPISEFIKVGFKAYAVKMTAFNSAMSYNVKNAITGDYPDYSIDYSNALVSRGALASALNPSVSSTIESEIAFSWDDNSTEGNANTTDKAMVLVLNPGKKEAVYIVDGATRNSGTQTLTVPGIYTGDTVECYIAFIALDGTVSNSKFAGEITVFLPR